LASLKKVGVVKDETELYFDYVRKLGGGLRVDEVLEDNRFWPPGCSRIRTKQGISPSQDMGGGGLGSQRRLPRWQLARRPSMRRVTSRKRSISRTIRPLVKAAKVRAKRARITGSTPRFGFGKSQKSPGDKDKKVHLADGMPSEGKGCWI
jgi:hypothetical protein